MDDDLLLAWAAGFFDGEGTVNIYLNRTRGRPPAWQRQVSVHGTHEESIRTFARIVGCGNVYLRPPRKPEHRVSYTWAVSSRQAEIVLRRLMPYLIVKRRQAELLLRSTSLLQRRPFEQTPPEVRREMERLVDELRALNGNQKSGRVGPWT